LPPPTIDWQRIRNPAYARAGWSVKDAAMIIRGENIYVFFSAFFPDEGRERCHVSAVRTRDFLSFTEPLFIWSGVDRGFWGFCSPNIGQVGDTFVLTDNSWGDKDGQPNQLFYATSRDLERWDAHHPLAATITRGRRAIDAALAWHNGMTFLGWKEDQTPQLAIAQSFDAPMWRRLGSPGGGWFENAEFLSIDNVWYLLATGEGHRPFLARLSGNPERPDRWLQWGARMELDIPRDPSIRATSPMRRFSRIGGRWTGTSTLCTRETPKATRTLVAATIDLVWRDPKTYSGGRCRQSNSLGVQSRRGSNTIFIPRPHRRSAKTLCQSSSGTTPDTSGSSAIRRASTSDIARRQERGVDAKPDVITSSLRNRLSSGTVTSLPKTPTCT
jgi:hypothetical protein